MVLYAILVAPSDIGGLTVDRLVRVPAELAVIVAVLVVRPVRWLRAIVVLLAICLLVLRLADIGTGLAFGRPFNPVLDLPLLVSGWDLLSRSIGRVEALVAIAVATLGIALLTVLLWLSLGCPARLPRRARGGLVAACAGVIGWGVVAPGATSADLVPRLSDRFARMSEAVRDVRAFAAELANDPVGQPTFAALRGRDVFFVFIESYGRTFLEDPRFSPTSLPRLRSIAGRLDAAGWHARTAWAAAPIRGGQSWLSHGTALSGLWIASQARYDRLMASDRRSLNTLFRAAGWRTAAAMPAITLDWPEAAWYGYDVLLDAAGLAYGGEPFEWVTMPDQYVWSVMGSRLRDGPPVMIEAALITSHAPWTPLPRILPWDDIGDGAIFDGSQRDGDSPREVWADRTRIHAQYALSLDYALEVMGQYVTRFGDGALFIVMGDHQPARLLTGADAPPDVPVHFIADDPALLDHLPDDLFRPGLIAGPEQPVLPMQDLRTLVATAFEAES